jgi:hypothetical protein
LPDLDYISGASDSAGDDPDRLRCGDDHQMFAWLRAARPAMTSLAEPANSAALRRQATTALALQDVFDTFSRSPIPAWRNYQEFLARAQQNPASVARMIGSAGPPDPPQYLRTAASREAVAALLADLPARLNSALDAVVRPNGGDQDLRDVEDLLALKAGELDSCGGAGTWIVTHVPFFALQEDVAIIWRGDEEALLSDVSPYPLALAAIEIMRPRYYVFFVPFEGAAREASTAQRREVGRVFFQTLADTIG